MRGRCVYCAYMAVRLAGFAPFVNNDISNIPIPDKIQMSYFEFTERIVSKFNPKINRTSKGTHVWES